MHELSVDSQINAIFNSIIALSHYQEISINNKKVQSQSQLRQMQKAESISLSRNEKTKVIGFQ